MVSSLVLLAGRRLSPALPRFLPARTALFSVVRHTSAGPPPQEIKPGSFKEKMDTFLKKYPKVHAVHSMVVDGCRWCFDDLKTFVRVKRELSGGKKTLSDLSRPELEVLIQNATELPKICVVMVLLPLPLTVYVIGFAVIFFPRLVLTRHFWSDQQRHDYFLGEVKKALAHSDALKQAVKSSDIRSAQLPQVTELSSDVMSPLCSLYSMWPLPSASRKLSTRASATRLLDSKLEREISSMTDRQIIFHLYLRRLDYTGLDEAGRRTLLNNYLAFSRKLSDSAALCAPAFFHKETR